jgi:hypothetical protein
MVAFRLTIVKPWSDYSLTMVAGMNKYFILYYFLTQEGGGFPSSGIVPHLRGSQSLINRSQGLAP